MESILIYGTIILIALIGIGIVLRRKAKQKIMHKIRAQYGNPLLHTYDERSFNEFAQYYRLLPMKEKCLDTQTWEDLQLHEVFKQLNHTQSQIGASYLYRRLRNQELKDLDTFEEHVQFFENNQKVRENLQYVFHQIRVRNDNQLITYLIKPSGFSKIPFTWINTLRILTILLILLPLVFAPLRNFYILFTISMILLVVVAILYSSIYKMTWQSWEAIKLLCAMIPTFKKLQSLPLDTFKQENESITRILKKMSYKTALLTKLSVFSPSANQSNILLLCISMFFGIYGWFYKYAIAICKDYQKEILEMYEVIGYIDTCIATASYRKSLSYYCIPTFSDIETVNCHAIYHPLLKNPISNTKEIQRLSLITGANASGKTTFARTLALNVVLSQTLHMAYAKELECRRCQVYTAISISDNLLHGESFYMAEINRLKEMLEITDSDNYVMFFIDEILKGTNTIDRIAASSTILEHFALKSCFLLLTTHDIELTSLLKDSYTNYYFKEETTDNEIHYDYLIHDGITTGSNAIALLKVCHYDENIIKKAKDKADLFRATNHWKA